MSHQEQNVSEQVREQGFRMTPQRQMVLDAVCEQGGHVSANDVIATVQQQAPALNRATVYRVLQFLCDLHLVTRTEIGGQAVYELARETPHHHLVCRLCGQIVELPNRYFEPLAAQLLQDHAFHAELNHLAISGVCAHCHVI